MIHICNLNVIVKKQGVDVTERLANATAVSYARNKDADGIYLNSDHTLKKSSNKLNIRKLRQKIKDSTFILSHQRLATSGKSEQYHHPFMNERWVLIHNGVFTKTPAGGGSDTSLFFEEFTKAFEREGTVEKAINKALEEVEGGSFSVFLYDKLENVGYYFKNESSYGYSPSIYGLILKDGTYFLSSNSDNAIFFRNVEYEMKIESEVLYKFRLDDGVPIWVESGKIVVPTKTYSYDRDNGYWNSKRGKWSRHQERFDCDTICSPKRKITEVIEEIESKQIVKEEKPPSDRSEMNCLCGQAYQWNDLLFCIDCNRIVDKEDYEHAGEDVYYRKTCDYDMFA